MGKWTLNIGLLENLFHICGCGTKPVLRRAGVSYSTWRGWMSVESGNGKGPRREDAGVTVQGLIRVCNELRVPVTRLFCEQGSGNVSPYRHELVMSEERFRPVKFNMTAFRGAFGRSSVAGMNLEAMLSSLGVIDTTYRRWLRENNSPLRVAWLERICDTFGYSILSFFEDDNPTAEQVDVERLREENARLRQENDSLLRDNTELRELADRLKNELEALKIKLEFD